MQPSVILFAFAASAAVFVSACSSAPTPDHAEAADAAATPDGAGASAADSSPASKPDSALPASPDPTSTYAPTVDAAFAASSACNTLLNAAPVVTTQQVAEDPPASQGGTVADGTYTLVDVTIYTGPGGPVGPGGTAQTMLQISGATIQVVSAGSPSSRTVTLSTSGTAFTSTDTCPDDSVLQGSFTATPAMFAIEIAGGTDDAGARTVVETFARQ